MPRLICRCLFTNLGGVVSPMKAVSAVTVLRAGTRTAVLTGTVTQLFSDTGPVKSEDWNDYEEICGLPDNIVSAKKGSDIIERLKEKKQKDHTEVLSRLQGDLSAVSVGYESLLRRTAEDMLLKLSEYDDNVEKLLQNTENVADLEAFSYQDLHEIWNTFSLESTRRRKHIQELDETLLKYENERATVISALLRKYVMKLEKISYVMPSDVHRLIDSEAMMINQALLANRRALAKLNLNLMEKNLQKEIVHRQKWETKLQDWKRIKVLAAVNQFRNAMKSPEIQSPESVEETLMTMRTTQQVYSQQRIQILEQIRNLTPPRCSTSLAAEWHSSLSSVNEQIDCMHIETMKKLHKCYENTWQGCLPKVEHFKNELSTYGFTPDEIQDLVNAELLPVIDKLQTGGEERLSVMDKAFEDLAKTATVLSKSLFEFVHGAAHLWDVHRAGLQKREQQLQDQLEEVRSSFELDNQKKEAHLDVMMDKLRQESTEEALKAALEKIITFLEEVKNGYVMHYKEEVDTLESYPAMVLEELHTYRSAVSRYFGIKEVSLQSLEELHVLYPTLMLDTSQISNIKRKKKIVSLENKCPNDSDLSEDEPDYFPQESRDTQTCETFTTAKGNVLSFQSFATPCDGEADSNLEEVKLALYPKSLVAELQKVVREEFFSHLEERYHAVLNNTVTIMEAKREELKSKLELRLHLHQPRAKRIEMDIHNVRAAELVLHRDRVDRHCRGIVQALAKLRTDFSELQIRQHAITEDFRSQIHSMEDTFNSATKSDKLVKLSASLQTNFAEHMNVIQESQRHFRQDVEVKCEGLREANAKFMKSFKLFSEGGNFTPKEIEVYQKRLEKMAKRINSTDKALMLEMEGTESRRLEQAKDIISRFEEKLHSLTVDVTFLEKIQGVLTNTQVQIKAEAFKSNMWKKTINTMISELEETINACAQPSPGTRVVTPGDLSSLTTSLIEELRKRCHYLDCFLDPSMAIALPDTPLQGAFAVAARPRSRKEKVGSAARDPLLQPSRMGVAFIEDAAVGVIKALLRRDKPEETSAVLPHSSPASLTGPGRPTSSVGSGQRSGNSHSQSALDTLGMKSAECVSVKRFSKPTRLDKRFQVFGTKPEDQENTLTFKGCIDNILWEANDTLLRVAEDFYKRKERRPVSRPQYIQDSFEQCAEEINKRLLLYQSQSQEYHSRCVQEFRQQLKAIEEKICEMPAVVLTKLSARHSDDLNRSVTFVRRQFEQANQQCEQKKSTHSRQLRVRLSHPACEEQLSRLVRAEENRQEEQRRTVQGTRLQLEACIRKHADEFVTALAVLSENLLFQLDNILTVDEVKGGLAERKQENFTTLVRQKQSGISQEEEKTRALVERGRRTWPGVHYFGDTEGSSDNQQQRHTATITTAKTTVGHLKTIDVRNALHKSYKQRVTEELERVEKTSKELEAELLHWEEHWRNQLKILSTLNSE
ncbi:coiled-coil domain-containing protein 180 isoform X2 [Brachyhypopomus gauderio]|uniref:coiled-coil domain-containing protein 180 isoform X2 n=1 Tax=Brachyhypopomus gauderio TaxID=698409 RepID=UPI004042707A